MVVNQAEKDQLLQIAELCRALSVPITGAIMSRIHRILKSGEKNAGQRVKQADMGLEKIQRFRGLNMHRVDTVGDHVARLQMMISLSQHSLHIGLCGFDFNKARHVIQRHDLPEGMNPLGDIPTPLKRKLSPELKILLDRIEQACYNMISWIPDVGVMLPDAPIFGPENHKHQSDIMQAYLERKTPWAQVVKYFDILDAFMESLYEFVFHGSEDFGKIAQRYRDEFERIRTGAELPAIAQIYGQKEQIFARLEELFGNECPNEMLRFSRAFQFFDIENMQVGDSNCFQFWTKHVLPARRQLL